MMRNAGIRSTKRLAAPDQQACVAVKPVTTRRRPFAHLLATLALAVSPVQAEFTQTVIDAGFLVEHPLLHAGFDSDENSFVVLSGRDQHYARKIAVYRLEHGSEPSTTLLVSFTAGPRVIAYDIGRLGKRDTLVFITPGSIMRLDPNSGSLVTLIEMNSLYGQERSGEVIPLDFFRDLNGDGLDDLLVPDLAGHRVRLQLADGSFGEEALLKASVAMALNAGSAQFEPRPMFVGDANLDGLDDLVTWRGDALYVYLQKDGLFSGDPLRIALNLELPTEAHMNALDRDRGAVDQSELTTKRIWSVSDFNSDGLPDILTEATLSKGVFDKRNTFRMHLGREAGGMLAFDPTEDALLDSKGLQFGLVETDLNGDGRKDLIVRKVRMNFGRVIGALLSGSVSLQIQFFKLNDNDRFPERANFETKTKVKFSMTSGQIDIPAVRVADFDGDQLQDLLIETRKGQLALYLGEASERLFSSKAQAVDVALPRNGELVEAGDINGDGAADLAIRYTVADGEKSARTVRLLLSRQATP